MKARIEWKENDCWKQVDVQVGYSRNNNCYFKHNGTVFVFSSLKEGTEVVTKTAEGKWIKAGRVTRGGIFLGDGLSYSETNEKMFLDQKWEKPVFA
jgi:hypothetical protein